MTVLDLNNADETAKFQQFIQANGIISQDILWGQLKSNWGHLYVYRTNESGDIVIAMGILTVEVKTGGRLAYASKGPIGDVTNIDLVRSLVDEALENLPDDVFLLRMDPETPYDQALRDRYVENGFVVRSTEIKHLHGHIQPRHTVVLPLGDIENDDQLMLKFKRSYRNNVRHAIRDGVTIRQGDSLELMQLFFETHEKMAETHGITHRPFAYFKRMQELYEGTGLLRVFVAELTDENGTHAIASGIGSAYGSKIWDMYGGSDRAFAKHYPAYLVKWELLKWGLSLGKKTYDFGGVGAIDMEDGLYHFKHGFAYKEEPVSYLGEIDVVVDQKHYDDYLAEFAPSDEEFKKLYLSES